MSGETVTRHSFLVLRDEHGFISEGFEFLDEKRMLLAQRILTEYADYQECRETLATAWARAIDALADALGESGLLSLAVATIPRTRIAALNMTRHAHFGVPLLRLETPDGEDRAQLDDNASLHRRCAEAFVKVTEAATAISVSAGNLHRLIAEYRRTDRRARALENVVLPEISSRLREIEAALEDNDLEESLRTRLAIATGHRLL